MTNQPRPQLADSQDAPVAGAAVPISSTALFGSGSVVQIAHEGETYTLRKTRNDKLILTK